MKKNPECRHCHREIGRDEPLHQHLDGKFACEEHRYYAVIMEIESDKKKGGQTMLNGIIIPDFDLERHIYTVEGREVPSVTNILRASSIGHQPNVLGYEIPDDVMENARERGEFVHSAIGLLENNDLDEESLDAEIAGYVEKYKIWREDAGYVSEMVETPLFRADLDFAGTPDGVGWIGDDLVIIDVKTGGGGIKPWHSIQLAAYVMLINCGGARRIIVDLSGAKPKTRECPRKELGYDQSVFKAARFLWAWREINGMPNQ